MLCAKKNFKHLGLLKSFKHIKARFAINLPHMTLICGFIAKADFITSDPHLKLL